MLVTPVDATDADAFASWFAAVDAGWDRVVPGEPGWQPVELRAQLLATDAAARCVALAAADGAGVVVGAGWVELHRYDNTHLASVWVVVPPAHRRGGVGSAVLAAAEQLAVADGRRTLNGWQADPADRSRAGAGGLFAAHHGFGVAQRSIRRDLAVPIDAGRLGALRAECARAAVGYGVETFSGPWPERWLADRLEFGVRMSTDAPRGEGFDLEDEVWSEARLRATEAVLEASNRLHLSAVAVHEASGRPVAFSEIEVPRGAPVKAYQHDTLVLADHRGHRLGTLVKVANLEALAEASPATSSVSTSNAADNDPMIAVNEALGCVVVAEELVWQKSLGGAGPASGAAARR